MKDAIDMGECRRAIVVAKLQDMGTLGGCALIHQHLTSLGQIRQLQFTDHEKMVQFDRIFIDLLVLENIYTYRKEPAISSRKVCRSLHSSHQHILLLVLWLVLPFEPPSLLKIR
jgi:hypothetical protein